MGWIYGAWLEREISWVRREVEEFFVVNTVGIRSKVLNA
jgi:hypothetical protein